MFESLELSEGINSNQAAGALFDDIRQEAFMSNKFEARGGVEPSALSLPGLALNEDQIAKVETATTVKHSQDGRGGSRNDYYLGDNRVFSDTTNNGVRTRTSYDMLGRAEGKRTDYADGRSDSTFKGDFDTYRVVRDKTGITVLKDEDGKWVKVTDSDESNEVLQKEKQIFTPPRVVGRS